MCTRIVAIVISIFCCIFLGGCDFSASQVERDFKDNVQHLNQLMRGYNKIPQKQKVYEHEGFEYRVFIWKDEEQSRSFYEKNRGEFRSIDAILSEISRNRDSNVLFDDAMFARAILYMLWTQIDRDQKLAERAIAVLREYVNIAPEPHIEEPTKTAIQESFWNSNQQVLTPSLSYEENVRVLFQGYIAYLFLKLKEYGQATKEYEAIVKTYPNSKFSPHAREQIKTIQDILEGRITIPDIPPQ
jgi:tetratricopeptide (TPR) repeat protein